MQEVKRSPTKRMMTKNYITDHVLDNIDIKGSLEKNKTIPKIDEKLFIYTRVHNKPHTKIEKTLEIKFEEVMVYEEKKSVPLTNYFSNFSFLGNGAYGTVYSAFDKLSQEKIAIKVINQNNIYTLCIICYFVYYV